MEMTLAMVLGFAAGAATAWLPTDAVARPAPSGRDAHARGTQQYYPL